MKPAKLTRLSESLGSISRLQGEGLEPFDSRPAGGLVQAAGGRCQGCIPGQFFGPGPFSEEGIPGNSALAV